MKAQKFGKPDVSLSWFIREDSYTKDHFKTTLEAEEGKKQLIDTILLLLDQGKEIRIGSDGCCLILEANDSDDEYTDASYQYVDDDHEIMLRGTMPDDTYEYFFDEEEYKETLKEFLIDHPYYKQNEYGHWYDEREQEAFKKEFLSNEKQLSIFDFMEDETDENN